MRRLLFLLPLVLPAQSLADDPPSPPGSLRFDSGLVQVDAVVTGRDGKPRPGLTAGDFDVLQDGKREKITHFTYVGGQDRPAAKVAIVVDDIDLSLDAYTAIHSALTRFIDLGTASVSLVYTSHGTGALRRFTSDRAVLSRALQDSFWRPASGLNIAFPEMSLLRELDPMLAELGAIPGKKSLVLIAPRASTQVADVRGIADRASRASVAIYGIDANMRPHASREGDTLSLLAAATGGRFHPDCSSIFERLIEAAEESAAYYLIGWTPGPGTFRMDPKRELQYHRVQIRPRDHSLHVRTRDGFFSRTGSAELLPTVTGPDSIREMLDSPFGTGELDVRLTSSFQRQEAAGSYVSSMLEVAAQGLHFSQDTGGCWNARVEVARALRAVNPGMPVNDRVNSQVVDVHTCGAEAERVLAQGLVAAVEDRVPTAGAYQVRLAVRDASPGGASGTAAQFLAIPDLKTSGLALSGIRLWSGSAPPPETADVEWRHAGGGDPAVRRFAAGDEVHYSFRAFGDGAGAADVRLRVLRDGKEAAVVQPAALEGVMPLAGLPPGRYVVGAIASSAAGKKSGHAEQWVDFEIR